MDTGVTGMRQTDLEADTGVQRRISKTFKEMKQEKYVIISPNKMFDDIMVLAPLCLRKPRRR